jgi:hypothetical protein
MKKESRTFLFLVLYSCFLAIFFISGKNYIFLILSAFIPLIKAYLDKKAEKNQ